MIIVNLSCYFFHERERIYPFESSSVLAPYVKVNLNWLFSIFRIQFSLYDFKLIPKASFFDYFEFVLPNLRKFSSSFSNLNILETYASHLRMYAQSCILIDTLHKDHMF